MIMARGRPALAVGLAFAAQAAFARGAGWLGTTALAGCALALHGIRGGRGPTLPSRVPGARVLPAAVALLAASLAVRMVRLDAVPPVLWDEAVQAYDARCVDAGLPLAPLPGIHYHRGPGWTRMLALAGRATGFAIPGLRRVSALSGAATVVLTFLAAVRWLGWAPALFGGAVLAALPWHAHLSRLALGNGTVPLAAAAIALVATAGRMRPAVRGAVAGGIAGLAIYGYAGALGLPPFAMLAVALPGPAGGTGKERRRAVLAAAAVSLALVAPAARLVPGLWDKARAVSAVSRPALLARNLHEAATLFHMEGDPDLRHAYPAGAPAAGTWLAPCLSLGLAALVAGGLPAGPAVLLVGWMVLGMAPGLASEGGARNLFRMAGAAPALALLAGVGAGVLARALGTRTGWAVAAGLLLGQAAHDRRAWFDLLPADPAVAVWYRGWTAAAGRDLAALASRPGGMILARPLSLAAHPVELLAIFPVRPVSGAGTGGLRLVATYPDPWGQPQAALLTGPDRSHTTALRVEYRTLLDLGEACDTLIHAGRGREAAALMRRWTALLPRSAALQERLGFAELKSGGSARAVRAFREALRLGSRLPATYDGLAGALLRQGRFAEAEEAAATAVDLSAGDPAFMADLEAVRRMASGRGRRMGGTP